MKKVVIYRAADAFLYLPTYIAEHTDVFKTKNLDIDIDFRTAESLREADTSTGSDYLAIKNMVDAHEDPSSIPIALCDPMAIFENPHFSKYNQPENLKVIGTLIDKAPFWAVSITNERFNTMREAATHFDAVICYRGSELITGYYIGTRMWDESGIEMIEQVDFRKEMDRLLDGAEISGKRCVAVTVDIIRLAQAQSSGKKVYINYRFSEEFDEFLTSCLITTAEVCEAYPDILRDILEGIQRSIFMFRTSEKIARGVCRIVNSQIRKRGDLKHRVPLNNDDPSTELKQWCHKKFSDSIIESQESGCSWLVVDKANGERYLAEKKEDQICLYESSDSLTEADIAWIVKQLHEENFYPNSLITLEGNWKASIDARAWSRRWGTDRKEELKKKYNMIVNNQFAHQAQDSIMEEISGISFQEERENFAGEKKEMEKHLAGLEKVHRRTTSFLLGSTFLLLLSLFWFSDWTDKIGLSEYKDIRSIKILLSGLFGLVVIFTIVFWRKGWCYICAAVGIAIILGVVGYFFWGLVISLIISTIGSLISTLMLQRVVGKPG